MKNISVIIVEDEFVIAEDISQHLKRNGFTVLAVFDTAEVALPAILQECPDILLVDIKLAGVRSGIELVQQIQSQLQLPIIYITANSDPSTFVKAKNTRPHAFLVKPFTPINLVASIELALFNYSEEKSVDRIERNPVVNTPEELVFNKCLFVRQQGKFKKVNCDDILFVEASGSYVTIKTKDHSVTIAQNLSQFESRVNAPQLLRIHRSYLVNVQHVDSFEENAVFIGENRLPLSDSCKKAFFNKIRTI